MADVRARRHEATDEVTPLLGSASASTHEVPEASHRTRCSWPWLYVVALAIVLAIVSCIGEDLWAAPRVRLFEAAVCAEYYAQHDASLFSHKYDIPEHLCKLDPIQDQLAALLGWQLFFDSVPAILLPIPFGNLADRRGRKWIMAAAVAGFAMSYLWTLMVIGATDWSPQWVWFSSAFFIIGGGPTVATTLLTTVVADVVPPESRSTVFFYRFCTDVVAELTIPPLASYLMSKNIWIALLGAALCQSVSALMVIALPETAPLPTPERSDVHDDDNIAEAPALSSTSNPSFMKRCGVWFSQTKSSLDFVVHDKTVAAIVLTFLISKIGRQSTNVLFQYVSKRFGWTLSKAGLLLSLRAAVNIALYAIVLPLLGAYILSKVGEATRRDLLLARGSIIFLLLGTFVLALSATPALMILGVILFTLGTGFPPAARSLVTALVESRNSDGASDIGRLYAVISVMEGIGSLIAALGLSGTLRIGFRLGRPWFGLPFAFSAILFAFVAVMIFSISSKRLLLTG